jgi:hypothetical protein
MLNKHECHLRTWAQDRKYPQHRREHGAFFRRQRRVAQPAAVSVSEQLVAVSGVDQRPVTYLNSLDWQRDAQTFSSMAVYRNQDYNFTGRSEAERQSGYMISADFFSTLGVRPRHRQLGIVRLLPSHFLSWRAKFLSNLSRLCALLSDKSLRRDRELP